MSPIKNYTTTVAAKRSVSEIHELLSEHGAGSIAVRNVDRVPVEITFSLPTTDGEQEFTVPADIDGARRALIKASQERNAAGRTKLPVWLAEDRGHAIDVAWRITKDWIEATCAIIEAGLAEPRQAFLAYAIAASGRTVYEEIMTRSQILALPAPGQASR